jgi:hypothetical protein
VITAKVQEISWAYLKFLAEYLGLFIAMVIVVTILILIGFKTCLAAFDKSCYKFAET